MDGDSERRAQLKIVYKTRTWWNRVDNMTDAQVFAIWKRFKRENKL